jgi:hypothetical protein
LIAGGADSPFGFSVFMLESRFGSRVRVGDRRDKDKAAALAVHDADFFVEKRP